MKLFFWKLIGGDPEILLKSGKKSKRMFYSLGVLYSILSFITFFGFFSLLLGVFDRVTESILGGIMITFVIQNMYRLILITLEPNTLPTIKSYTYKFWAYFIRITVVVLISIFVSKCIETLFLGHLVDDVVQKDISQIAGINQFDKSSYFVKHMIELNKIFPWVNIITFLFVIAYLLPIILKHKLKNNDEYFDIKKQIDKQIVVSEYTKFRFIYAKLMNHVYVEKNNANKRFNKNRNMEESMVYNYYYKPNYYDEPFNTKQIKEYKKYKNTQDFINQFE